jgi:hypothetical protein
VSFITWPSCLVRRFITRSNNSPFMPYFVHRSDSIRRSANNPWCLEVGTAPQQMALPGWARKSAIALRS